MPQQVRRAQGATYFHGCLYFDHSHPPEPGYGYVAASRFKSRNGIYLYGKVRRTDFIPVHAKGEGRNYQHRRSDESDTDYDSSDEEYTAVQEDLYMKYGPTLESDAELSDGDGSDSSCSYNDDEAGESYKATRDYFSSMSSLTPGPPVRVPPDLFGDSA